MLNSRIELFRQLKILTEKHKVIGYLRKKRRFKLKSKRKISLMRKTQPDLYLLAINAIKVLTIHQPQLQSNSSSFLSLRTAAVQVIYWRRIEGMNPGTLPHQNH